MADSTRTYVDDSNLRMSGMEQNLMRTTQTMLTMAQNMTRLEQDMSRMEQNLDILIQAITAGRTNGKKE